MKKLIALVAVALIGSSMVSAKLVRSRTVGEKAKTPTEWIIRTGLSINNATGSALDLDKEYFDESKGESETFGSKAGWDVSIAFNKPISNSGLYWGMELGLGSRGASAETVDVWGSQNQYYEKDNSSISTLNAKYSPFTIGYKYNINGDYKLDLHLGGYVSYDFSGTVKTVCEETDYETETEKFSLGDSELDEFNRLDAGLQVGIGVWYKKFNFDITYQRGFLNAYDDFDSDDYKVYSSNLMLRVGYSF